MTFDDLSGDIRSGKLNIFPMPDYVSMDNNLRNFHRYQFSFPVNMDLEKTFGIKGEEISIKNIISESTFNIHKQISKKLFESSEFDYLDISTHDLFSRDSVKKISTFLISSLKNYQNILTNAAIGSELQDMFGYTNLNSQSYSASTSASIFPAGKLLNSNIFIDPVMKFNENKIALFDKVFLNIKNIDISIAQQATFAPLVVVKYDLDIKCESKVLYIISANSQEYKKFISIKRDMKIDDLLS